MTYEQWRELETAEDGLKVNGRYMVAYRQFMYNIENEYKCWECPNNNPNEIYSGNGLPCGQQNCWVWAHCKGNDNEEELL